MTDRPDYASRAKAVLEAIEANRDHFSMDSWVNFGKGQGTIKLGGELECGTTMCIAGWAAVQAGWRLDTIVGVAFKDDQSKCIADAGAEYLGLADNGADAIFFADEDVALIFLREMAKGRSLKELIDEYLDDKGAFADG